MRLTVVGCSGSYPGPDSSASCYLLEAGHAGRTWRILLDLGSGALGALHRHADPLRACPRFVDFVEQGVTGGEELLAVAHDYLDPLVEAGVDTLILGCTHYPLLTGVISYVMGDAVTMVSSAEECAKDVYRLLADRGLMRQSGEPRYVFSTTGSPDDFATIGRRFLGSELLGATQFAGGLT